MTTLNKDEILVNFQACTGIEDVEEAIMWLEESDWDLLVAVRNALPQETQALPSDNDIPMSGEGDGQYVSNGVPSSMGNEYFSPTSSRRRVKMIEFDIWHMNEVIKIQVSDLTTIGNIKTLLLTKTGIPLCEQRLTGWIHAPTSDDDDLRSLRLPKENVLALTYESRIKEPSSKELPNTVFKFEVFDETHRSKFYVEGVGLKPVSFVKLETARIAGIPVNDQLWYGWPRGIHDNMCLMDARLTLPVHELRLRDSRENKVFIDLMDSDSSIEECEETSEMLTPEEEMYEVQHRKRVEPLIPELVQDEATGAIVFAERFANRYGDMHPSFFQGSLEDAIKEACLKPARERRLLALYLHDDKSVLSNVFCTQLLCFESVLQTFTASFVVWGWDITFEINKARFLQSVTKSLGAPVADTISSIQSDHLPALIIITRSRSNTELFSVINGNIGISEFITMLIHAVDVYYEMQKAEIVEEDERDKRERIKTEQDRAYELSLLEDMAKEEAKKKQEQLAQEEQQRMAKELKEREERLLAERRATELKLPEEPSEGQEGVIKIRFRCPQEKGVLDRKFLLSNSLEDIFNYLLVQGYAVTNYKVISSWPRKDLTSCVPSTTLNNLNLHAQETMILEER